MFVSVQWPTTKAVAILRYVVLWTLAKQLYDTWKVVLHSRMSQLSHWTVQTHKQSTSQNNNTLSHKQITVTQQCSISQITVTHSNANTLSTSQNNTLSHKQMTEQCKDTHTVNKSEQHHTIPQTNHRYTQQYKHTHTVNQPEQQHTISQTSHRAIHTHNKSTSQNNNNKDIKCVLLFIAVSYWLL